MRRLIPVLQPESVFFYTTHKSASTLFSKLVLRSIPDLKPVDYSYAIYSGTLTPREPLRFSPRGHSYGPIRVSVDRTSPVFEYVVKPLTDRKFIQKIRPVIFIRDPRDVLVSAYFSFGFTHPISPVSVIAEKQKNHRDRIQAQTIDAFVLERAEAYLDHYETLHTVARYGRDSLLLRYEDLIDNFDSFVATMRTHLPISDSTVRALYEQSRPLSSEKTDAHRRSGKVGGYHEKLQPDTIQSLDNALRSILTEFDYSLND